MAAEFARKTRRMIELHKAQQWAVVREWTFSIATRLVKQTPGPQEADTAGQYPLTEYVATGRLRAGWDAGPHAPAFVPLMGVHHLEDPRGDATVANMKGKIVESLKFEPVLCLWNWVGYGWWVHEGLERHEHIGRRPWVEITAELEAGPLLDKAKLTVMTGGAG
jgi:hypothetical protein